jgi:hypothetical protein
MKLQYIVAFILVLTSALMHFPHFSKDIISVHAWRQTQTQSAINNFYEEDMNIFNPRRNERGDGDGILRMEFPLMQYCVACLYKVFGKHLIISRLFMFFIGFCTLLGLYKLLKILFNNTTLALIGAWALNFSPSFYYYTINPLPDNFALCASIWGVYLFFLWHKNQQTSTLLISSLCLGIGALCKLPFILYYIVPLTYFLLAIKEKKGIDQQVLLSAIKAGIFVVLPLSWYAWVVPQWSNGVVTGVISNEFPLQTLLHYLNANVFSTLPELLLNYAAVPFFLVSFYFIYKKQSYKNHLFPVFVAWGALTIAYFGFEINMIATVHDYYLFPFYPLLFILVAYGANQLLNSEVKTVKYFTIVLLLLLPITAHLRMKNRWNLDSPNFNKDLLDYKNELRNAVPKDALCIVGNDESHFIFFYYVDKKGWGFNDDELTETMLKEYIQKGAKYLYSDSRAIDENPNLVPYFKQLIIEKGSIKVYQLQNR